MRVFGYVRVSTKEQNTDRQLAAMIESGVNLKNIFIDKQSGKDFDRPAYKKMMKKFKKDDLLIIKSIDRLGRNYDEILEQWRIITKERGIHIRVLDMPLLDTTQGNDLMGTFIADLVLQLLSFVSQTERDFIKQRQAEGIAIAKEKGIKFGAPEKDFEIDEIEMYKEWLRRDMSVKDLINYSGMSKSTFYRKMRMHKLQLKNNKIKQY